MIPNLAIVIPAYKPDFFRETLRSIQQQTDQRFSLYIFDDASPANLELIAGKFSFDAEVFYKRFEVNAGRQSLVKQWERCIDEIKEDWIWLFSDDDIMAPDCVESFHQTLREKPGFAAYRFNTRKISSQGEMIRENSFPPTFDGATFLNLKLAYEQESYIVEYIFSQDAYKAVGGFPDLPLAWTTDDLFCLKLADYKNICTISGGCVSWRYSDSNISGKNHRSSAVLKMKASALFVNWIMDQKQLFNKLTPEKLPVKWYVRQIRSMQGQLTFWDELRAVIKMAKRDRSVWAYYFNMKKSRCKFIGWLKKFSS